MIDGLTITNGTLDALASLYRDAKDLARKVRAEHADLTTRSAVLVEQSAQLDSLALALETTAHLVVPSGIVLGPRDLAIPIAPILGPDETEARLTVASVCLTASVPEGKR